MKLAKPLLVAAFVLVTTPSRADDPPPIAPPAENAPPAFTIGPKPAWIFSGGVTSGDTLVAKDRGGFLGGEVSLVRLQEGRFSGVYADGYYDLGAHRTYASSGVELGYKFVGFDGGIAARMGGKDVNVEWAPTARIFVTIGILSIYGRYAYFVDPLRAGDDHVVQIGGLLKLPFAAWGGR